MRLKGGFKMGWLASWFGGQGKGEKHELKLTVRFEEGDSGEFQIPACGHGGIREFFPFEWNIDWGDGVHDCASGSSSLKGGEVSSGSLVHQYAVPGEYEIVLSPVGKFTETRGPEPGWLQAFGYPESWVFTVNDDGTFCGYAFPKGGDKLICVDGVLDDYAINFELEGACAEMFSCCKNIAMGPHFTISSSKQQVGDYFCFQMFYGCSGDAFTMGDAFQLPQDLRTVGKAFCCKMFYGCCGKSFTMNDSFNLPRHIAHAAKSFCQEMFGEHGPGLTMGKSFNLPQYVNEADDNFCCDMFSFSGVEDSQGGSAFTMNEVFNLPPNISGHVGNNFCSGMFRSNNGQSFRMNDRFNLPQRITGAGDAFCKQMFSRCGGDAFTMNEVFNMPPHLNQAGSECCMWMFSGCCGASFHVNEAFDFPDELHGYGCLLLGAFEGCDYNSLNWWVRMLVNNNPNLQIWSAPFNQRQW